MFSRWSLSIFNSQYRVKGGTNVCTLCHIEVKDLLIFISRAVVHSVCQ